MTKEFEKELSGRKPIVPEELMQHAKSFAQTIDHAQLHFKFPGTKSDQIPNRRGYGYQDPRTHQFVRVLRGVDWIGSGEDDGTFLATMSDDEYHSRVTDAKGEGDRSLYPDRQELDIAGLFPKNWRGERVLYEITVKAKVLTKDGAPIVSDSNPEPKTQV